MSRLIDETINATASQSGKQMIEVAPLVRQFSQAAQKTSL